MSRFFALTEPYPRRVSKAVLRAGLTLALLTGCAPEIGSEAWCNRLEEQPRGDWTVNEATGYARHCVFN